jgi:hypothetical protein
MAAARALDLFSSLNKSHAFSSHSHRSSLIVARTDPVKSLHGLEASL